MHKRPRLQRIVRASQGLLRFVNETLIRLHQHHGSVAAAALSFYVFLALAPLLLLAAAVLGFVLQSHERAYEAVAGFLRSPPFAISGVDTARLLEGVIGGSAAATGVGLAALAWAGTQAFASMELAFDMMWKCKPRPWVMRRLVALGMMLLVGALLLISFGLTTMRETLEHSRFIIEGRQSAKLLDWAWRLSAVAGTMVINIVTFTIVYKVIPNRRVTLRAAAIGGITAGALWEIAKQAFSYYLVHSHRFSLIYGPLSTVIVLLLWIYYSSLVTVASAEVVAGYESGQEEAARRRGRRRARR